MLLHMAIVVDILWSTISIGKRKQTRRLMAVCLASGLLTGTVALLCCGVLAGAD